VSLDKIVTLAHPDSIAVVKETIAEMTK